MQIINAPKKATFDFLADGLPVYVIDGKPLAKISERGKADRWEEIPLSEFSPTQLSEIKRLAEWRNHSLSEREKIVNAKLAKMVAAGL